MALLFDPRPVPAPGIRCRCAIAPTVLVVPATMINVQTLHPPLYHLYLL